MKQPVSDEVRAGIEQDAMPRIVAPRDKDLMAKWKVSRSTLYRIMREARVRLMQKSQSIISEKREDSGA